MLIKKYKQIFRINKAIFNYNFKCHSPQVCNLKKESRIVFLCNALLGAIWFSVTFNMIK